MKTRKCGHERVDGTHRCGPCQTAYRVQWAKNNRDKVNIHRARHAAKYGAVARAKNRAFQLRLKYGITPAQYDDMFTAQNGCCAICKTHQSALPRSLAVDHCHKTKKIRSLLCGLCNMGLGKFHDNAALIHAAAAYLDANA